MIKRLLIPLFIPFFILTANLAVAQEAQDLQFSSLSHDFGTIQEEAGPVLHEFKFKNTGSQPVTITEVKASCGCTTPGWSKEPVAPGEEGFIQAQYSTYNRPGPFNKTLTVLTDKDKQTTLYIRGVVIPKPQSVEEELPTALGNLRVKYRSFNMGKVYTTNEPTVQGFEMYNSGDEDIIFKRIIKPAHVAVAIPDTLKPGQKGIIELAYDAVKKEELGFFSENVTLITNEPYDSIKSFTLFTNIEEYFPPMTQEELMKAPRLSFGEQVFDFNRAKSGDQVTTKFQLVNIGRSTLSIRKVDSNCTCVKAILGSNDLQPGESTFIETTFDTTKRRGNQQKAITVYSNDPTSPVQRLTIKGYIETED